MNNGMMKLNPEAMETVNGGVNWDNILKNFDRTDVLTVICGGPVGEAIEIYKLVYLYTEEKEREARAS